MLTWKECRNDKCKILWRHCSEWNCEPHCHEDDYAIQNFLCVKFIEDCRDHQKCEDGCHDACKCQDRYRD